MTDSDPKRKQSEAEKLRLSYCDVRTTDDDWTSMWLLILRTIITLEHASVS